MHGLKSRAFIVGWGTLFVASNFALLAPFGISSGAGDMLIKALPLVIAGIVGGMAVGQADKFKAMASSTTFLSPLLLLCMMGVLSGLWSGNPGYSIFRAALSLAFYLGMGCYAGYVQYHCSSRQEALRLLFLASALAVSILTLMGLLKFEQAYRFTEYLYGRRLGGTVVHPNALGLTAGMVILMFINNLVINQKRPSLLDLALLLSCTYALLATQSRSALLITAVCASLSIMASRVSLAVKVGLPLALCIGLLMDTALRPGSDTVLKPVLDFLARDASAQDLLTLSNRTAIWGRIDVTAESLFVGHGYMMLSQDGGVVIDRFATNHAHNGFVQVFAGLGVIGLLFAAWWFIRLFKTVTDLYRFDRSLYYHAASYTLFFFLSNFGMSGIGFQFFPHAVLFVIVIAVLRRAPAHRTARLRLSSRPQDLRSRPSQAG
jgi:O-antigen ligase